jgi:hypothetical protein
MLYQHRNRTAMTDSQIGSLCAETVALLVITKSYLPYLLSNNAKEKLARTWQLHFPNTHNLLNVRLTVYNFSVCNVCLNKPVT